MSEQVTRVECGAGVFMVQSVCTECGAELAELLGPYASEGARLRLRAAFERHIEDGRCLGPHAEPKGATCVAMCQGTGSVSLATLPDGSVLVAQADAPLLVLRDGVAWPVNLGSAK